MKRLTHENSTLRLVAVLILFWEFHVAIIHMIWFLEKLYSICNIMEEERKS
jgi:hypothetical protein